MNNVRMKRLLTIIVVTIGVSSAPISRSSADPPSCVPFNDPCCFFGENWENGTISGWAVNVPSQMANLTPGLAGTNHAAQLTYVGTDLAIFSDTSVFQTTPQGGVVWIEFYVKWSPSYQWGQGCCISAFKIFEWDTDPVPGGPCNTGRMLLDVVGPPSSPSNTQGVFHWSLYPNVCGGGTGVEVFGNDNYIVTGGVEYHVIIESKLASGLNGYMKMWVNGTLVVNARGIQTTAQPGPVPWAFVRMGGQYSASLTGSTATYDQIRITTTNLAPSSGVPSAPTGLHLIP